MPTGPSANTVLTAALIEELARSGVRRAVISPGSRSTPLAIALWRHPGIETTVVIDERSAAFIALGAAAASGRPVVLACTSGTAGANYHPAVAEADLSSLPLIVLTADRPPELRDNGSGQTIDQVKLYGSAVRWFCEVGNHDADDTGLAHFRTVGCRAFAAAAGDPRPGPVHLNLPFRDPLAPVPGPGAVTATDSVARNGRDGAPLVRIEPPAPALPDPDTVTGLAARLAASDRVLLLAGRQADPKLREPLSRLAAAGNWPLLAEPTSQLLCGPHDRSRLVPGYARLAASAEYGVSGLAGRDELTPDLVLRFGELPTSKGLRLWLGDLATAEQVVISPFAGFNEPTGRVARILRADPVATATALADAVAESATQRSDAWPNAWRDAVAALPGPVRDGTGPMYRTLAEALPDGSLVYVNSSMPVRDLEAFTPSLPTDLRFLANRGANGIDGLIASGLGAALEHEGPVVVVTGDVGFLHDLGSLASWQDHPNRPHLLVIDNGGGAIFDRLPQKQAMPADEFEALMRTPPGLDIPAAARLFGLPCVSLDDPVDLPALLAGDPCLIHAVRS